MNGRSFAAMFLIVVGCLALAFGQISFTHKKTVLDVGPVKVESDKHERIPLPPVLGAMALVAGCGLLLWPRRA